MQVRINKYISESGYCSRREADKYIEQGCVTIDGKKAEIGSKVSTGQVVKLLGDTIANKTKSVIIAYNKPAGIVTTTDPQERDNVINTIAHEERIFPIGRLDKDSQGLLLLTNEGDIVNKILRVNNNHDKEYFVTVDKAINADFITKMQGGIPILGVVTRKCEIVQKGATSFTIVLRQGLNRQIRRMCEHLGYNVTKLQRTRIMHIQLGDLKVGQWRNLTPTESETLYSKIASSAQTEEASVAKKKSPTKSNQPAKSQPTKELVEKKFTRNGRPPQRSTDGKSAAVAGFRSAKAGKSGRSTAAPVAPAGRNTSYKPKGKTQRRTR